MGRKEKKRRAKGMTSAELSIFCGQVALILEAGLPLFEGMEILADADQESENAQMYRAVSQAVIENGSLYEALRADERWPAYLTEMAGVGERAGQLDRVMRGLEKYYAREDRIRDSIKSAVTYPLTLGAMLVVIVLIMLWKVLPVFRRVLSSMGMGTESSGGALMRAGSVLGWIVLVLVAIAILAVLALAFLMRTRYAEQTKRAAWRFLPSLKLLNQRLSASRVSSVLSMMLSGGFRTEEALEKAADVLSDREAARKVEQIRRGMTEQGQGFAEAVAQTKLFRELEGRMIRMGSATGREDQVLEKIGDLYEEQVEQQISRLVGIIEPTLVALLCIVIGAVLLSVMLPMAGMLSAL